MKNLLVCIIGACVVLTGCSKPKPTLVDKAVTKHKSQYKNPASIKVRKVYLAKRDNRKFYVCGESSSFDNAGFKKFIAVGYFKSGTSEVAKIVTAKRDWAVTTSYTFDNIQRKVCDKKLVASAK